MKEIRLIDANALQEKWKEECGGDCATCGYLKTEKDKDSCTDWIGCKLIDNAPTVEITETEIQAVLNKRCMTAVANEYLIELHGKSDRPHGKPIIRTNGDMSNYYICSECHYSIDGWDKFCRNCGASMDMRGKT